MKTYFRRMLGGLLILLIAVLAITYAQQPKKSGNSNTSDMADEQMNKRGDHVMGFDHTKTTHHF